MKRVFIWFSRHELSAEQIKEINNWGAEIVWLKDLANKNINDEKEAQEVFNTLCAEIKWLKEEGEVLLGGVFPTIIRNMIFESQFIIKPKAKVYIVEAWNVNRSPEGEKPSFRHYKFLRTCDLFLD